MWRTFGIGALRIVCFMLLLVLFTVQALITLPFRHKIREQREVCERAILAALSGGPRCFSELKEDTRKRAGKKAGKRFLDALWVLEDEGVVDRVDRFFYDRQCGLEICYCQAIHQIGDADLVEYRLTGTPRKRRRSIKRSWKSWKGSWGIGLPQPA